MSSVKRTKTGWKTGTLKDLVFFQRGFDITKEQQKIGDVPVISSSGIKSFHSEAKVKGPGVIIGRKGTLGSVHFSECDYWPHDTTLWSKELHGNNPRFVYYFLKTLNLSRYDVGNSNPTLNRNHIHALEIQIPSLNIQNLIVETLSNYDNLIENNRRRIQLLEQSARLLYKEWFVHLRFPGHEHVAIVDGVPEGWEKTRLQDVALINNASLKNNSQGKIQYIDITSVTTGSINETTIYDFKDAPSRARRVVKHGDIIWSCVRPNRQSHAIIWNPPQNLIVSTGFAVITPESLPTSFLYQAITTPEFVGYLSNNARGAAYPAVTASDFEQAELLIPPMQLLDTFDNAIAPTISQIQTLKQASEKLRKARDLFLPRLMNGDIAV